ncbi:MAG: hypothetical protein CR997_08910 [Acidobacteria bacterium]|nr:MAG: hypothetical protein CR997_08910 [Acidobacteriota bacterium]
MIRFALFLFFATGLFAQTRIVPHLTKEGGGFYTTVFISNTSNVAESYTLKPYGQNGELLALVNGQIPANTMLSFSAAELFGSNSECSHFLIENTARDVQVHAAYQVAQGPGSAAHLNETSQLSQRFRFLPGNWDIIFDGMAVVNLGNASTDVLIRQYDYSGRLIKEVTAIANLSPNAKGLYVVGSPQGGAFTAVDQCYFEVLAGQGFAMTALRGTPPGAPSGYLWENAVTPLELRDLGPLPLDQINFWAYQIQEVNLNNSVDELVNTHYDMLVLEPTKTDWSPPTEPQQPWARDFDTAEMIDRLKASKASDGLHRKLLIAYIDIGQAEDWRWYWTWDERLPDDSVAEAVCNATPFPPEGWPEYIVKCDPDQWLHNYPVLYWYDEWINIVIHGQGLSSNPYGNYSSIIDQVIQDGFDGIYLDWVEAAEDEDIIAIAQSEGLDPVQEMIWFIEDMRAYAVARNPNFVIIQQNAASLIGSHPGIAGVVDAIAQEAIWYDGDATDDWQDVNGYDHPNDTSLVDYYLHFLDQYQKAGVPVFACEYALNRADDAYTKAQSKGFIPYVTRRSLSRLTTTPPPNYD